MNLLLTTSRQPEVVNFNRQLNDPMRKQILEGGRQMLVNNEERVANI